MTAAAKCCIGMPARHLTSDARGTTLMQAGQKDWVLACSGSNFAVWEALL